MIGAISSPRERSNRYEMAFRSRKRSTVFANKDPPSAPASRDSRQGGLVFSAASGAPVQLLPQSQATL